MYLELSLDWQGILTNRENIYQPAPASFINNWCRQNSKTRNWSIWVESQDGFGADLCSATSENLERKFWHPQAGGGWGCPASGSYHFSSTWYFCQQVIDCFLCPALGNILNSDLFSYFPNFSYQIHWHLLHWQVSCSLLLPPTNLPVRCRTSHQCRNVL